MGKREEERKVERKEVQARPTVGQEIATCSSERLVQQTDTLPVNHGTGVPHAHCLLRVVLKSCHSFVIICNIRT